MSKIRIMSVRGEGRLANILSQVVVVPLNKKHAFSGAGGAPVLCSDVFSTAQRDRDSTSPGIFWVIIMWGNGVGVSITKDMRVEVEQTL